MCVLLLFPTVLHIYIWLELGGAGVWSWRQVRGWRWVEIPGSARRRSGRAGSRGQSQGGQGLSIPTALL
jgi:hypothetical protein